MTFWTRFKSAITGRFVSAWWARRHPKTTYGERVDTRDERQTHDGDRR